MNKYDLSNLRAVELKNKHIKEHTLKITFINQHLALDKYNYIFERNEGVVLFRHPYDENTVFFIEYQDISGKKYKKRIKYKDCIKGKYFQVHNKFEKMGIRV